MTQAGPGPLPRPRGTKSSGKSADTRRRVVDAAARVLMEKGYAATRLSDIATAAGLQAGSLYYHFDSKEDLVEEVLRYGLQFAYTHVRVCVETLADGSTPTERLCAAVQGFLQAILEIGDVSPAHVRTYPQIPPEMRKRLRPLRRAFAGFWEGLVAAAIDAGEIRTDADPQVLQLFIINALEKVAEWPQSLRSSPGLGGVMQSLILDGIGVGDRG